MKKQIAVLMAAATAVTTVAPVVANAEVNKHENVAIATVVEKAKAALADKYADKKVDGLGKSSLSDVAPVLNSRYIVVVNTAGQGFEAVNASPYKDKDFSFEVATGTTIDKNTSTWFVVDDAAKLGKLLEANPTAKVAIFDKGGDKGAAYRATTKKHYVAVADSTLSADDRKTQVGLDKTATELMDLAKSSPTDTKATFVKNVTADGTKVVVDKVKIATVSAPVKELEVELTSGAKFTFRAGSDVVDLTKALNKDGQLIAGAGVSNDQSVLDTVTKFELVANEGDVSVNVDYPSGDVDVYDAVDAQVANIEVANVYTKDGGYTERGADFVNNLIAYYRLSAPTTEAKFNFGGYNYIAQRQNVENAINDGKISKTADGYELKLGLLDVKDANDTAITKKIQFIVKGKTQEDLNTVLMDLKVNKKDVVAGHFKKLAGSNRYATAIEVSRDQYELKGSAESVVIVGGEAKFDGLSAAPLAALKKAPMLLAHPKKGLSQETLDEIGRVVNNISNKTIYIVGGENSVPASVEKQLKERFDVTIVRMAGADRTATSIEVAKRFNYDGHTYNAAFFVGANSAADAMSASSVAARGDIVKTNNNIVPIVVMKKDGLDRSARTILRAVNKAYIVGGDASVSFEGYKSIKAINSTSVTRLSGADRYATNVEVVNEFYPLELVGGEKKPTAKGIVFASGANQYLVDAQTSGAYAASKKAPIVLAGSKMTSDQSDLFKKGAILEGVKGVVQVGGAVASGFMKQVVDILGL